MGSPLRSNKAMSLYSYGSTYGAVLEYMERRCDHLSKLTNSDGRLCVFTDSQEATDLVFSITSRLSELKGITGERTFRDKVRYLWDVCLDLCVHGSYCPADIYELQDAVELNIKQMNKWVERRLRPLRAEED